MMKYPFTPEILDAMPEKLAELFRELEDQLLEEICSRLDAAGELNQVTVEAIRALRAQGIPLEDIEAAIQRSTGIARVQLDKLLDDVVERNRAYYGALADLTGITAPEILVSAAEIEAIRRQTWAAFENITGSMGFLTRVGGRLVKLEPYQAYSHALDKAEMIIQSGAVSYNQAIAQAVKELADGGMVTKAYVWDAKTKTKYPAVMYESKKPGGEPLYQHLDVCVRRAVMTGINQLCDKYTTQSMEFLNTRYCEVSAHSGARDKGSGWQNHKSWQGKVYYESEHGEKDPLGKYEDLHDITGFGEVDGLEGANCRHHRSAFVPGVMERTYSDKELRNIDPAPFEFEGKTYTAYEATQKQREIERTMRKVKREETAFKAAGCTQEAQAAGIKRRRLSREYTAFSAAAGLKEQRERMAVYYG